jgi:hyperosmotically inducible periplasmic protein
MCGSEPPEIAAREKIAAIHPTQGHFMKTKLAMTCVVFGALLGSAAAIAAGDAESTGTTTAVYVKDSAITTKVKTKLAADHLTSMGRIHVETDQNGVVWLSGTARSQEAIDKAVSIARDTEHVKSVHNDLTVRMDD